MRNWGRTKVWVAEWGEKQWKLAQEMPESNRESKRNPWNVERLGWAKGKKINDLGSDRVQKRCKERKSQGANGLVANQSWVMTTLPWARLTDGDHLSALALPRLPQLLTHGAKSSPLPWTLPLKTWHHTNTNNTYTVSPVRVCPICQFINHVRNGYIRRGAVTPEHHISCTLILQKERRDYMTTNTCYREGVVSKLQPVSSWCYFLCSGSLKQEEILLCETARDAFSTLPRKPAACRQKCTKG